MKSPAVNFYTSDFLTGTAFMSNKVVGSYIKALCYQHQLGRLSVEQIAELTKDLNEEEKQQFFSKFLIDKTNKYYNKRMEFEINKKQKYSESRANNRKIKNTYEKDMKNICNSYEEHMENEIENINISINNKEDKIVKRRNIKEKDEIILERFNEFWKTYPRHEKKAECQKWYLKNRPDKELHNAIVLAIKFHGISKEWEENEGKFIPYPTTYLNQKRWEDFKND